MKTDMNSEGEKKNEKRPISYWTETLTPAIQNPLKENLETDVVIVGGGIAGLSVAYCLVQSGKKVVLVEDGAIGSGETGHTTAHFVTALDDRYYHFEKIFSEEEIKLIAGSHREAINFVERTVKKENIDCEFERLNGYLFLHPSDKKESLHKELRAALKAGVEVKAVDKAPGMLQSERALCFLHQAQLHPLKYLNGLCNAIKKTGGKLFTDTHASLINHEGITTKDGFTVKAKHIVVATNSPVNNLYTTSIKQSAYRTYVIGALVKKDLLPKALWWDTGDFEINSKIPPYHYVRLQSYDNDHDLLISGGEDHLTAHTGKLHLHEEDHYKLVEDWTRKYFPIEDVIYHWSGQVLEPMDGIAFIGRNSFDYDNVYIVTGDSGNGMTHCSFAGLLISDLINKKENKWEHLYSPARFKLRESGAVVRVLADSVINTLKKWFYADNVELTSIKNGEAGIVKLDVSDKDGEPVTEIKCGAYRNEEGKLFLVSAECMHLGCIVHWNNDEKSWDCPCHGSRYTYEGKVINGPANFDLPAYSEKDVLVNSDKVL
jgi:glycine/D-amino acid oxidase-like deaminating enzyme/nitrite reductase/ring-hydroxylating ferredoxin subunit